MSLFRLDLYDKNRNWIAPVGAFESLEGTKRWDNISDLSFTVKASHKRLPEMMTPGTRVRCQLRGQNFISGPIRTHDGFGPNNSGTFTFGVEDNFRILRNFLIFQVPGDTMANQSLAYNYTQTGPVETVFKDIVRLNIQDRSWEPIIIAPDLARGGVVTAQARMAKVYNEMFPLLESKGFGVTVDMTPAGLVVDLVPITTYPNTLTEASRVVRKWKYHLEAPSVNYVVVGGQGQGEARTFIDANVPYLQDLWGDRIEEFRDARDASDLSTYYERADETLFDGQGNVSLKLTLAETKNFKFGGTDGLNVGQQVTCRVADGSVEVTDLLREIDFSYSAEDGLKLTGTVGQVLDPQFQMAKAISALADQVARLKASQ